MLTFNLKKEWFNKIKTGEKTHEYRIVNDYWTKRLEFQEAGERKFDNFCADFFVTKEKGLKANSIFRFALGYPNKNEKNKYLLAKVKSISIINGKNTDLAIDSDVYDIEFELLEGAEDE